jgi:pyruvate formate lyase activating enzyme
MRNGIPVSVGRAVEQLGKYRHGLKVMSGGVTISGGEPLLQQKFVFKVLAGAKKLGIHTAIETNGYLGANLSDADLANLDLVLLGIKSWDPVRHKDLTGREIGPTLDFARRLATAGKPIWVRFVLVPGVTDFADDIAGIAKFAASLGNVQRVEVLPFHQMGRFKWQQLGMRYRLEETQPPTPESHEQACAVFRAEGLEAF